MEEYQSNTYLIVGLGNPGREYRYTRHNIGFMVIDKLAVDLGIKLTKVQAKAIIGTVLQGDKKIILAKPQTFMNLSGQAVTSLLKFYKIPLDQFLVIHDDIDLPTASIRIRPGGGSAGQKGLGSIIERVGTQMFARMRIGVGRPPGRMEAPDYVLHDFDKSEQPLMERVIADASKAAQLFVSSGLEIAMNQYNGVLDS